MIEPTEITNNELSGTGWEIKTESGEWVTVPNNSTPNSATVSVQQAQPISTPVPLQGTPNAPTSTHTKQWSGEIYQTPQTVFDETYSEELWVDFSSRAPTFKMLVGRFDPFDKMRLRPLLEGSQYSTFINRTVLTFRDSLEHAMQLAMFWREEDDSVVILSDSELAPHPIIDNAEPQQALELAKQAWKDAVAQRDKAMQEWNYYVAEYRLRYQIEKSKRNKK
jgi:hypothetical protein